MYGGRPLGVTEGTGFARLAATVRRGLLLALFPAPCLACGRLGAAERPGLGLCPSCRARLRPLGGPGGASCAVCARPLAAAALPDTFRCGACRERRPRYDRLVAGWSYEPPLDEVIRALKFGRLEYLGRHLAEHLAPTLDRSLGRPVEADLVVPVPLHWRRRLARGYNQAEAISRPLAARLGLEHADALRRRRATPPQTALERRDRVRNLRGAFALRRRHRPRDRRVLLVDDVVTTGATLEAAAACLKRAGAARVTAVAAARTPGPEEAAPRESARPRSGPLPRPRPLP